MDPAARERPGDDNDERWLFANSYYPGRSAEFLIRYREYLMPSRSSLTTHGTPYLYDRQVPIVLMTPGRPAARRSESIATVDIAPTLEKTPGCSHARKREASPPSDEPITPVCSRPGSVL